MDAARQPAGIPAGGQFAATAHAEPEVNLAVAAAPRPHDPEEHALLLSQADRRQAAIAKMQTENDKLSLEAVSSGVRRDFPTATELRVKQHFGERGTRFNPTMASVRDKDGTNLTKGNSSWDYLPSHEGARPIMYSFTDIRPQFFDYQNDFGYDAATGEVIVPLDRNYAEGIELT